jgi:hypothetical protein
MRYRLETNNRNEKAARERDSRIDHRRGGMFRCVLPIQEQGASSIALLHQIQQSLGRFFRSPVFIPSDPQTCTELAELPFPRQ